MHRQGKKGLKKVSRRERSVKFRGALQCPLSTRTTERRRQAPKEQGITADKPDTRPARLAQRVATRGLRNMGGGSVAVERI